MKRKLKTYYAFYADGSILEFKSKTRKRFLVVVNEYVKFFDGKPTKIIRNDGGIWNK